MMVLTMLALLAMLYAPTHAYLDCYPNPGCKTAIGKAKISIGEKHQGVDGSWTFFSDVKCAYCGGYSAQLKPPQTALAPTMTVALILPCAT